MKILVISFNDSDNLTIENVLYELEARNHELTIYAQFCDENSIRMFRGLKAQIKPISELNNNVVKEFDFAFCASMTMRTMKFFNIYCFVYSLFYDETYMTDGADFMFTYRDGCLPKCDYRCATMQVGDPKNDKVVYNPTENSKRILYIDSGHMPFGKKGKTQIANMLLEICKNFPDYELCIKPRWLRNNTNTYTHKNAEHIYDVIEECCNGDVPSNMNMLNEHLNLQELIDSSISVITLYSGAHLNVILQNKGLIIASNWDNEDKWDIRNDVLIESKKRLFSESGCIVDYREVVNYLPEGIIADKAYEKKMFPYKTGASVKIADTMEYVYENFLKFGKYPEPKAYTYETFKDEMIASDWLTLKRLKYERIRDIVQQEQAIFSYRITADIDFSEINTYIDVTYLYCKLDEKSFKKYMQEIVMKRKKILIRNAHLLENNAVDQSFLLQAYFDCGQYENIICMSPDKILCVGAWNYYAAQIYKKNKDFESSIQYFYLFLHEANSRPFEKYNCESNWGIRTAYANIIRMFNKDNLSAQQYAEIYLYMYETEKSNLVSREDLRKMHSLIPYVYQELVKDNEYDIALHCGILYFKNLKALGNNEEIGRLKKQIKDIRGSASFRLAKFITWVPSKIIGGVKCLKTHGMNYTIQRLKEKLRNMFDRISNGIKSHSIWKIHRTFYDVIMAAYQIYAVLIQKYGDNSILHLSTSSNGDNYLTAQYYKDYVLKRFPDTRGIFVSSSNASGDIAEWFGIKDFEKLTRSEWNAIIQLYMFCPMCNINIMHNHIFKRYTGILAYLEGLHGFTFMSMQDEVLFEGCEKDKPSYTDYSDELMSLFEEHNLQIGATVMLSPYAQAVAKIPDMYWIKLASALKDKGLSVCTNAVENQLPVLGTCRISLPYNQMVQFLDMAGYFVSNRSGIDDITHDSVCRRAEVYAKNNFRRGLSASIAECYSYTPDYIEVSVQSIDSNVEDTLRVLGFEYSANDVGSNVCNTITME